MKLPAILVVILAAVQMAQAVEPYRTFTNTEGKTIKGRILSYDGKAQTVTIERENRKKATVPISVFISEDQDYILEWDAASCFTSSRLFKISCDKQRLDTRREEDWGEVTYEGGEVEKQLLKTTSYTIYAYTIGLRHTNKSELTGLSAEYVIYYEQSEESWEKPVVEQKHLKGTLEVPPLAANQEEVITTDGVEIYTESIDQKNWVSGRVRTGGKGDLHGCRIRIYMTLPSGTKVMREVSYPEGLSEEKYPWVD